MCSSLCRIQLNSCALAGLLLPPPLERQLVGMGPEFNEFPDTYRHVSRLGIKSLEQAVGGTRGTVNANDDKIKKPHGIISCEYVTNILEVNPRRIFDEGEVFLSVQSKHEAAKA